MIKNFFRTYCADINPNAVFSDIPIFPHLYFGIFISQGAVIGKRCTIFHHVTIGSNLLIDSKSCGYPIIGDDVYIGTGAKIIGNVKIGNNVRIGANTIVFKDVPDNTLVTGNNMKLTYKENMDNRYFSFDEEKGWAYQVNDEWIRDLTKEELIILESKRLN